MNKYFIAAIPPAYLSNYITGIKQSISEKYNTKGALNQPPHITLVPPFELQETKEPELIKLLEDYISQHGLSISVTLENYGSFPPKVIFISVNPNNKLNNLAANLNSLLYDNGYSKQATVNYHPHVTVAFKDLTEENYELAWQEYSKLKPYFQWQLTQFSLLKYESNTWSILHSFS